MSDVVVGVTGTQQGMTDEQSNIVSRWLTELQPHSLHHGDCVGVDSHVHTLARALCPDTVIVSHPPSNEYKRAFRDADVVLPAREYLDRNQDIVDACDLMIVVPEQDHEILRSGTWATYRRAKKRAGLLILVVWPDGTRKWEVGR